MLLGAPGIATRSKDATRLKESSVLWSERMHSPLYLSFVSQIRLQVLASWSTKTEAELKEAFETRAAESQCPSLDPFSNASSCRRSASLRSNSSRSWKR